MNDVFQAEVDRRVALYDKLAADMRAQLFAKVYQNRDFLLPPTPESPMNEHVGEQVDLAKERHEVDETAARIHFLPAHRVSVDRETLIPEFVRYWNARTKKDSDQPAFPFLRDEALLLEAFATWLTTHYNVAERPSAQIAK